MWLEAEELDRQRAEAEAARRAQQAKAHSTASPPDEAMMRAWEAAQRGEPFHYECTASAPPAGAAAWRTAEEAARQGHSAVVTP